MKVVQLAGRGEDDALAELAVHFPPGACAQLTLPPGPWLQLHFGDARHEAHPPPNWKR